MRGGIDTEVIYQLLFPGIILALGDIPDPGELNFSLDTIDSSKDSVSLPIPWKFLIAECLDIRTVGVERWHQAIIR